MYKLVLTQIQPLTIYNHMYTHTQTSDQVENEIIHHQLVTYRAMRLIHGHMNSNISLHYTSKASQSKSFHEVSRH